MLCVPTLVEATPISYPALRWMPQCVDREMAEPTVLVTPMHSAPRAYDMHMHVHVRVVIT